MGTKSLFQGISLSKLNWQGLPIPNLHNPIHRQILALVVMLAVLAGGFGWMWLLCKRLHKGHYVNLMIM